VNGRVAVVTGASSGLGRAIALALAHAGARAVVVADVTETPREGVEPTARTIEAETRAAARFVACDVTDPAGTDAAVAAAAELGGVEVFVNNAGVVGSNTLLVDVDDAEIDRVLAVNVRGVLLGCRAATREMLAHGRGGSIINLSSVVATAGSDRTSLYAASKGAVASLTYALSAELGPHGIRVNAVHPGLIETTMTMKDQHLASGNAADRLRRRIPLRRTGAPEDVAAAVVFLASSAAAYVTGTSTVVDGGWSRAL
jgi:NAD(P)-dependent dehydrogenase (short-subunit alcohol dehydrogenase family)